MSLLLEADVNAPDGIIFEAYSGAALWAFEADGGNMSSSLGVLPKSLFEVVDGLERVVASDALELFSDDFIGRAGFEKLESREGGSEWSGKFDTSGDCSREEGTDTTTGEDTAVPAGLFAAPDVFAAALAFAAVLESAPSAGSPPASFVPPTEAFRRLYSPLRPPCTSSMVLASFAEEAAGGAVRSSNVVRPWERDAVACISWSESASEPRESRAMTVETVAGYGNHVCYGKYRCGRSWAGPTKSVIRCGRRSERRLIRCRSSWLCAFEERSG
jgi:hypothetical protein